MWQLSFELFWKFSIKIDPKMKWKFHKSLHWKVYCCYILISYFLAVDIFVVRSKTRLNEIEAYPLSSMRYFTKLCWSMIQIVHLNIKVILLGFIRFIVSMTVFLDRYNVQRTKNIISVSASSFAIIQFLSRWKSFGLQSLQQL